MGKQKTHFEQVPLAMVMSVVGKDLRLPGAGRAYCAICNHPVELERCKTDEEGDAVHEECYVTKLLRPAQPAHAKTGRRASNL